MTVFHSPLEAGVRALSVLLPAHPRALDLQRLVAFDYLVVHTGDVDGPPSLHPRLPLASAELLVRRGLVERGLLLVISRGLAERSVGRDGISYRAGDLASTFFSTMTTPYVSQLLERGQWVAETFGDHESGSLRNVMNRQVGRWVEEFQAVQKTLELEE